MLTRPGKKKETGSDGGEIKDVGTHEGDLRILVFRSVITSSDKAVSLLFMQCMKHMLLGAASIYPKLRNWWVMRISYLSP